MKHNPYDRAGCLVIGENDYGMWFGTEDFAIPIYAAWPSRAAPRYRFHVTGYFGPHPFEAYVRAPSARRVREYFEGWRIRELRVERL